MRLNSLSETSINQWRFKLAFVLLCLLLLFLRRPMEFIEPYVWAEDGTWNIPHYLDYGFWSLFQPVQGYLILPSKIITAISLKLSFIHYPEISIYLSALFSIFCLYLIAFAPTLLRYRVLCSIAVILIPSNPEVFVLPLYSFWWGTLLIFLALLWNTEQKNNFSRFLCIVIAGLSSPIIILCAPLFILRAYFHKNRVEISSALLVMGLAAVQGYFVFSKADITSIGILEILKNVVDILAKFVGQYFHRDASPPVDVLLTSAVLPFLIWCWYRKRSELGVPFFLLFCSYAAVIFATVKRVPVEIIDPYDAGPRYFFYPFVTFSWALIWLYAVSRNDRLIKNIFLFLFASVLLNSMTKFQRLSESPDWSAEIEYCINNKIHDFPINTDGQLHNSWQLRLSKDQCDKLIDQSIFDSRKDLKKYPAEFVSTSYSDFHPSLVPTLSKIEIGSGSWIMNSKPAEVSSSYGEQMLSSWVGSDAFTGEHRLIVHPADNVGKIAFRTGPVSINQKVLIREIDSQRVILSAYFKKSDALAILEFDAKIDQRYEVTIMDLGEGWGEWSAIFIP